MRKLIIILALLLVIVLPVSGLSIQMNYCDDFDKYDDMMAKLESEGKVPNNFVYWDDISCLGEFNFCHLFYLEEYYYSVDDGYDDYLVYVHHAPNKDPYHIPYESYPVRPISDDMDSMLYAPYTGSRFVIKRDDIVYYYHEGGKLFAIFWHKDGVELELYIEDFAEYAKRAEGTAVCKLLSLDGEEFRSVRNALRPDSESERAILEIVGIATVVVLVAAALVGVLKRKPQTEELECVEPPSEE